MNGPLGKRNKLGRKGLIRKDSCEKFHDSFVHCDVVLRSGRMENRAIQSCKGKVVNFQKNTLQPKSIQPFAEFSSKLVILKGS